MLKEKILGRTKRFGARYGRKPKLRFAVIEQEQKKLYKCPYCNAVKVKRIEVGIWGCKKCNSKFTGKAYSLFEIPALEAKGDKTGAAKSDV